MAAKESRHLLTRTASIQSCVRPFSVVTRDAITARLVKLGLIEPDPQSRGAQRGGPPPSPRRQNNQFAPEPPQPPAELTEEEKNNLPF